MTTTAEPHVTDPNTFAALADALEAAAEATDRAQSDATTAAKFQSSLGKGAYYTTYGVSYGVVFSGVFLKELLPAESSLRRGFEQGVTDGAKAALGALTRFHALPEDALAEVQAPAGTAQP
jgi:hypothetical protein